MQMKKVADTAFPMGDARVALKQWEAAELASSRLINDNANLFETLRGYEAEKEEAKQRLKKLCYTKGGPPAGAAKTYRPVAGEVFQLEIVYKQRSAHYDPAVLPRDVLLAPGVVTEVDSVAVAALTEKHPEVAVAYRAGQWMTPSVSIKRIQ